ncbi:MAG: hypothetical protein C5B59_20190 [Bacteroidetes bacterium]|nr:MAG: hypothetical protein C5B59_20190 [Bacteroidota bacterium]
MKKLILISLLLPAIAKAQFTIVNTSTTNLVELRAGTWPLNLQRVIKESDTCYVLQFRDQQYATDVIMTTLRFGNTEQVRYFQKALSALKSGSNGDIARFKDYTVKRVDVKKEGTWYVLNGSEGSVTNFIQKEADMMIAAIQGL